MPVRSFDAVRQWWSRPPSDDQPLLSWVLFRLRNALIAGVVLAAVATVGYVVLEGYGWVDALYMTVITLGTVGYGEVRPLDTSGRFFTIGVIVAGFAGFVNVTAPGSSASSTMSLDAPASPRVWKR